MEMKGDDLVHAKTPLGIFLRSNRDAILGLWEARVRENGPSLRLPRAALRDHLPRVLERIADMADQVANEVVGGHVPMPAQDSEQHALQRLEEGFDLAQIVREYTLLREAVLDLAEQTTVLSPAELRLLNRVIDYATQVSITRFEEASQRTLRALDRISTEALGTHDLDQLLQKLLRILLETSPAADVGAILLLEDSSLYWRAAIGYPEALSPRGPLGLEESFPSAVMAAGRPLLSRNAAADPRLAAEAQAGVRAVYGIPLLSTELLGVIQIGSRSAYDFSDEDLLLFRVLATRVTAILIEARWHEESEATFSQAGVGVAHVGLDGAWLRFNQKLCDILGYPPHELRRRTYQDLTHPDDLPADEAMANQLRQGEISTYSTEKRYLRGDGKILWANLTVSVSRRLNGQPRYFISIVEDIDARKRAEALLAAERRRLQAVVEHVPIGVLFVGRDDDGEVIANAQAEFILGGRLAHLSDFERLEARRPDGRRYAPEDLPLRRALCSGETVLQEELHCDSEHGLLILEASAVPIYEGDQLSGAVGLLQDITRRQVMAQEAAQRAEFEKQLIGIVSHDLRNPLMAINLGVVSALRRTEDERLRSTLGRVLSSTSKASRLIDDLLDFTRARLGTGLPIARNEVDLYEVAHEAVDEIRFTQPERQIRYQAHGDLRGCWDANRLEQLCANLVSNALRYSPKDTEVEVTLAQEGPAVTLAVHNEGPPIPSELLGRIFEPFYRAAAQGGGLGLGLTIVAAIVKAHGGKVTVESTAQAGTTFRVWLPKQMA